MHGDIYTVHGAPQSFQIAHIPDEVAQAGVIKTSGAFRAASLISAKDNDSPAGVLLIESR
jgi:hypothetical protein